MNPKLKVSRMRAVRKTGFRRWWGFLERRGPVQEDRIPGKAYISN